MDFFKWMRITNPKAKGTKRNDALRLHTMRLVVADRAGTSMPYLKVLSSNKVLPGGDLENRLIEATKETEYKIMAAIRDSSEGGRK